MKSPVDNMERMLGLAARRALKGKRGEEAAELTALPAAPVASPIGAKGRHVRVKVTMNLDGDLLEHFKARALQENRPYQLLINDALRDSIEGGRIERIASAVRETLVDDQDFLSEISRRTR